MQTNNQNTQIPSGENGFEGDMKDMNRDELIEEVKRLRAQLDETKRDNFRLKTKINFILTTNNKKIFKKHKNKN